MEEKSVFKPRLRGQKLASETSLRGLENGFVRLVSEG